eukprot:796069-Prymnesium_polylepis.1
MLISSRSDLSSSPCVPPQHRSAARAQVRRDGSPGVRPMSTRARTTSWHVVLGRRCSVRDLVGRDPHVRVALATGVCGSQHENAAFEIVVVRSMMLCNAHGWSQITLYSHIRTVCGPGSASALPGSQFSHSRP